MEWLHRARFPPPCDSSLDEDHVPRLLQEHQQDLRLEMHSLVAMEMRTNIEEEALTAKTMMTSMRTTPYLLDPVLCCSSFSPSCRLARARNPSPAFLRGVSKRTGKSHKRNHARTQVSQTELKFRKSHKRNHALRQVSQTMHRSLYNLVAQAKHSKQTSCEPTCCVNMKKRAYRRTESSTRSRTPLRRDKMRCARTARMASAPVTRSAARMASAPGREACGDASEFITIEVIMEDGRPGEKETRARHRHESIPGTRNGCRPTKLTTKRAYVRCALRHKMQAHDDFREAVFCILKAPPRCEPRLIVLSVRRPRASSETDPG